MRSEEREDLETQAILDLVRESDMSQETLCRLATRIGGLWEEMEEKKRQQAIRKKEIALKDEMNALKTDLERLERDMWRFEAQWKQGIRKLGRASKGDDVEEQNGERFPSQIGRGIKRKTPEWHFEVHDRQKIKVCSRSPSVRSGTLRHSEVKGWER